MSTRLDRPEGSGVEESEYPAANGAGASDGEPSGPERAGVTSSERRVEQEQSVHLERPQALPDEALPGAGGDASAVRPRWSQPRSLAERSDVVLDASHLNVEELALEVEGDLGIKHLRLDTKGLEAQLFLKADLGNVVALVETAGRRTPPIVESARDKASARNGGSVARRVVPSAGAALAGLAAGGAVVARSKPTRWIARRAVDRIRGRSALSSFVRGLS
jgi:hypothetical protein